MQRRLAIARESTGGHASPADSVDAIYEGHVAQVKRWARRLAGPGADLEDLVHDVFLVVLKKGFESRGEAAIDTWLFSVTHHVVRSKRRRRQLRELLLGRHREMLVPASPSTPQQDIERSERLARLYRALDRLPDRYRTTTVNQPWVTVRIGTADSAAVFAPPVSYPSPASPFALLLADLDDDGHSDLVVGGTRVTLWRGAADGKFAEPEDIPIGLSLPWSGSFFLGAADWNRDGVLDLVYGTSTLRISLGRADGTFDKEVACGLALDRNAAGNAVADFDHDQKMDLVVLKTGILLGMNGCNFSSLVTMPAPPTHVSLDAAGVADLDGDGHADIVSATGNADNGQTAVNLGDGHGGFSPPANFPSTGRQIAGPFLLGDLNHDGKVDIIVTRSDGWRVLLNTCP
jgi:RNA polymerase sigma factor (sigma-70 family)